MCTKPPKKAFAQFLLVLYPRASWNSLLKAPEQSVFSKDLGDSRIFCTWSILNALSYVPVFSPDKGGFQLLGCSFASLFSELRIFILPLSGLSLTSIWKMHVYLCSGKASPGAHTRNASKAAETVWISALILTCKVEILILMAEWCKIKLGIPFKLSWVFFFCLHVTKLFLLNDFILIT